MEEIIKMKKLPNKKIWKAETKDGEILYISPSVEDLVELAKADDYEENMGSIALGYTNYDTGETGYGGCDPSNFINPIDIPKKFIKKIGTDEVWGWRNNYPIIHIAQAFSRRNR